MKTEIVKEIINQTYNEVYNAFNLHFDYQNRDIINIIALDIFVKICYEVVEPDRKDKSLLIEMIGERVKRKRVATYHSLKRSELKLLQFPEYVPIYESIKETILNYYPIENPKPNEIQFREAIIKKQLELIKKLKECI